MRLLTFNTLFRGDVRARLRALGGVLAESDFDVVCLQELMYRSHLRLVRQTSGLPYAAATGAVMLHGGLAILSRTPIRHRFARFPLRPPQRPEWLMRKGAQLAAVEVRGRRYGIVNTHLSANRDDDWSEGNRYTTVERAELADLARWIDGDTSVVVGDFNVPRESPLLAEFVAATGLRDALAGDVRPTYRPTPAWPNPPAFDHVLVRPPLTARAELVFEEGVRLADGRQAYLSDHFGVAAELR
ncbi:MAG: endonuclease/exonuclease/phosphatase family protein [Hamadaea sp.]|nr:endonuclease/exonuclease/phosphatase family protein [Hamadaea sp.]